MKFLSETFLRRKQNSNRIEYIDLAKGFCILLVILGHVSARYNVCPFIVQLRMPLYFLLSGLFFKDYGGILNLIIKKTNKLLIPFLSFYILGVIYFYSLSHISILHDPQPLRLFDILKSPLFPNNSIWFLLALFWDNLIFVIIYRAVKREWIRALVIVILTFIGFCISNRSIYCYFINSALISLPFFYLGYLLRRSTILKRPITIKQKCREILFIGSLAMICITLWILTGLVDCIRFHGSMFYGNPIIAYPVSVIVVLLALYICKYIVWLPFISFFGRYSLISLCTHPIYLYTFKPIVQSVFSGHQFFSEALLFILITIACWITIFIVRDNFPYVSAQKDLLTLQYK